MENKPPTDDTFSSSIAKALGDDWGLDGNRNRGPPRLSVDGPPPSYATDSFSTSGPPKPPGLPHLIESKPVPTHIPEASNEDYDVDGFFYLNPTDDDGPSRRSDEMRRNNGNSGLREGRKLRWDVELEKRHAEGTRKSKESTPGCLIVLHVSN